MPPLSLLRHSTVVIRHWSVRACVAAALVAPLPASAAPHTQTAPVSLKAPGSGLLSADARVASGHLVLTVRTDSAPASPWLHVFLDTTDSLTGFAHVSGGPAGAGLDLLVEGEILYRFNGDDPAVWSWEKIPAHAARRTLSADTLTLEIPLAALDLAPGRPVRGFVASYTENYSATLDTLPRGAARWTIDLSPSPTSPATPPPPAPAPAPTIGHSSLVIGHSAPAAPLPPRADARAAFKKIRSYHCYYGPGHTAELLTRDASIIEPRAQSPADVNALRAAGRLALGYISIGEDHHARPGDGKGPGGHDSAYFDRDADGRPDKNAVWNSYYANAASPSWRAFFLDNAARLRATHGIDGFFLDTIETCLLYPESRAGMVSLIRELRARHPDAIIVMNRGWDLLPDLGDTPDGLMFESFTLTHDFGTKTYEVMRPSALDYGLDVWRRLLRPAQEKHGLVVLALDYAASAADPSVKLAYDRAATLGMIPCVTSILLDAFYNIAYVPTPDPRWLENQETNASRILTLDTPRNGFPAGTRFSPDSNHADYTVAPVLDSVPSGPAKEALGWRDRAWASNESPAEHWLEFSLPSVTRATALEIEWAHDGGLVHAARDFRVEVQLAGAVGQWSTIARVTGNASATNRLLLPDAEFTGLRVVQSANGGSPSRPALMWVQKVRLLPQ